MKKLWEVTTIEKGKSVQTVHIAAQNVVIDQIKENRLWINRTISVDFSNAIKYVVPIDYVWRNDEKA